MTFRELNNQEFYQFSKDYNLNSIYQTLEYALVMNKQNFDSMFVGLIDENNYIVAASLILIEKSKHFKYAYAPRGFIMNYNNHFLVETFTKEIKKFLGKKNIIAIKISPMIIKNVYDTKYHIVSKDGYFDTILEVLNKLGYYHLGYNSFFEALKPRFEAVLDINVPYYIIFKNFPKQLRTKIRSAEKNGVKIHKGTSDDLKYLYLQTKKKYPRDLKYFEECYHQFEKSNKVEFFYAKLDTKQYLTNIKMKYEKQEELCYNLDQEIFSKVGNKSKLINRKIEEDKMFDLYKRELISATSLLRNEPNGIVLASSLIIKNKDEAFLLMDGYDQKYTRLNAKHLLLWKLCERYSKAGFKTFNFGGIADVNLEKSNNSYYGLNRFKLNFTNKAIEYIGDLELITNNTLYFMYQNTKPIRSILKK